MSARRITARRGETVLELVLPYAAALAEWNRLTASQLWESVTWMRVEGGRR